MKKHGLVPTDHTYTSMLSACAEAGPTAAAILDKVEKEIERRGVRLNNIGMNAHISALASSRRHQDALKVYLDMTKVGVSPDLHTYSGLLLASARDRVGGMIVAQRVWQEMGASRCKSDMYIYNLLLQCLRDAGLEGSQVYKSTDQSYLKRTPYLNLAYEEKRTRKHSVSKRVEDRCAETRQVTDDNGISQCVVRQTERYDFVLTRDQKLTLNLGYVINSNTQKEPTRDQGKEPSIRWLEEPSVDLLFHSLKIERLKPDIRLFNLLIQLVLDPSPVLKRMEVCGIALDEKVILTAVKVQARLGSVEGTRVRLIVDRY